MQNGDGKLNETERAAMREWVGAAGAGTNAPSRRDRSVN